MKTNLLKIIWLKEIKHWKLMRDALNKFNNFFAKITVGIIVVILISIFHYMFALMHTLYEILLYFFARNQFKANLLKLSYTL